MCEQNLGVDLPSEVKSKRKRGHCPSPPIVTHHTMLAEVAQGQAKASRGHGHGLQHHRGQGEPHPLPLTQRGPELPLKFPDPAPALASFWVFTSKWLLGFLSLRDTVEASGPTKPDASGFLGVLRD